VRTQRLRTLENSYEAQKYRAPKVEKSATIASFPSPSTSIGVSPTAAASTPLGKHIQTVFDETIAAESRLTRSDTASEAQYSSSQPHGAWSHFPSSALGTLLATVAVQRARISSVLIRFVSAAMRPLWCSRHSIIGPSSGGHRIFGLQCGAARATGPFRLITRWRSICYWSSVSRLGFFFFSHRDGTRWRGTLRACKSQPPLPK